MSNRILIVVLLISVAINLASVITLVFHWVSDAPVKQSFVRRPFDRRAAVHHRFFARKIGLDDNQIEQFDRIRQEMTDVTQPVRREIMIRRHELMNLLSQSDPDTAKAAQLIDEISKLQTEHERRAFHGFLKIRSILTPGQQEKMGMLLNMLIDPCPAPGRPCPGKEPGAGFPAPESGR